MTTAMAHAMLAQAYSDAAVSARVRTPPSQNSADLRASAWGTRVRLRAIGHNIPPDDDGH